MIGACGFRDGNSPRGGSRSLVDFVMFVSPRVEQNLCGGWPKVGERYGLPQMVSIKVV